MDFSTKNLLAFQNLWENQPELFSEEAILSFSQIRAELEKNLEKISLEEISKEILTWCKCYPKIKEALASERKKTDSKDWKRGTKGTPEKHDSPNINPQSYVKWMGDNLLPPTTTPKTETPSESPETSYSPTPTTPKTETPLEEETYHTDISCPRRVWVNTERISVTVRLTVKPSELSNAEGVNKLSVSPQLPVIVSIDAPAFKILNQKEQEIYIESAKDSSFAVFELQPIEDQLGHQRIYFRFRQGNNPIGSNFVRVEITSYEVSSAAESHSMFLRIFPDQSLAPDLMLYIEYDQSRNARSLKFELYEKDESISFEPKELKTDLESYVKTIYNKFDELIPGDHNRQVQLGKNTSLDEQKQIQINPGKKKRIEKLGLRLWKDLIPQELKDHYIENREQWRDKTLLIMSDDPYIPWEVVWPYNEGKKYDNWEQDKYPWCISMKMTRWLNHDVREDDESRPPTQLKLNKFACIAPRYSGGQELENAQREQEHLAQLCIDKNINDTTPDKLSYSKICELLQTGNYNWLHIAAHGGFNSNTPDDASAIYLEGDEKLTIDDMIGPDIEGHIWSTRPAFFFNTCHGGRQSWGLAGLGGWPNHLISSGASLLIAPLWRVDDEYALDFARRFYNELLNGKTVAEAVQLSRQAIFEQYYETEGDATCFTYSVYAHPKARIYLE